jgi:NTE family protein
MPKVGLVLSGGGVRGVAHLGVLQVLKEINLEPTILSGTSAGALVGAFHAAGHSIETVFNFFKTTPIFKITNIATSKPGIIDSDKFIPLFQEYFPVDDFAALQKKLYVTTTDLVHGKSKTFSSGPLIQTLLASAAVPVVFSPVTIDGLLYTDGGALNNFPVEPLTDTCDVIIGINVHPLKDAQAENIKTTLAVMERVFHLAIHHHSLQKYHLCNTVIVPQEVAKFGTFDRGNFEEIFEIGYKAAHQQRAELLQLRYELSRMA